MRKFAIKKKNFKSDERWAKEKRMKIPQESFSAKSEKQAVEDKNGKDKYILKI